MITTRRLMVLLVLLGAIGVPIVAQPASAATGWQPPTVGETVLEFGFPDGGSGPNDVAVGPDQRVWTTLGSSGQLGALVHTAGLARL